jgi:hypothetical protein
MDRPKQLTNVIAPFSREEQEFLKQIDKVCKENARLIKNKLATDSLHNRAGKLDEEDQGWIAFIRAYGILYNRAIEAGWITDIELVGKDNG